MIGECVRAIAINPLVKRLATRFDEQREAKDETFIDARER